jgi:dTMP kinase
MSTGRFITFEGSEGCGKTTQIARLTEFLTGQGIQTLSLREPGGTPLGEVVRELLKHNPAGLGMAPETELLLFAASRAELVRKSIRPALQAGTWVLCDRFLDSTTVYQGLGRGLDLHAVSVINQIAVDGCLPDLTLVLDLEPEEAQRRVLSRPRPAGQTDRMESEPAAFYASIRQGFLDLAGQDPARIRVLSAAGEQDAVFHSILAEIETLLPAS